MFEYGHMFDLARRMVNYHSFERTKPKTEIYGGNPPLP